MALLAYFSGVNPKKSDDVQPIHLWERHKPTKPQAADHLEG
jgi:hypothetical protein